MQDARRITEEQKVILDKVRHVHRFLQGLGTVCGAVEDVSEAAHLGIRYVSDVSRCIKAGSTAILSLYKVK